MGCNHHPATRSKTSSTGLESPGPLPTGQITGRFHSQKHNIWVFSPSPGSILVLRQFFDAGSCFTLGFWRLSIHVISFHPTFLKSFKPPTNFGDPEIVTRDIPSSCVGASAGIFTTCRASFRQTPSRHKSWMIYNSNYYPQPPTQKKY